MRWAAPAVRPVVGLMLFLSNPDGVGFYLLVLGAALCGYWVVFLVQQGISPLRLKSAGYGEDRPIVAEENEATWELGSGGNSDNIRYAQ